ncbi:hypothetical protein VTN00DRAFT_6639 [Thermoascus crustaceus]|uniref:uncharacterized protein n=1 Tax=Thermoascus crustaceus TaxID=5088 RepID=UPI003742CDE9
MSGSQAPESSSGQPAPRPATVEDMIGWLRLDGFYRGLVGWSTEYGLQELFGGPPDNNNKNKNNSQPHLLGFPVQNKSHCPRDEISAEISSAPEQQRDFSMNAVFRELSRQSEQERYVRRMLERHKRLIPAAVKEIDRRLVNAGVSGEEVQKIGPGLGGADADTAAASSVYAKLQRLEEARRPGPPPTPRLKIQVVCDMGGMERNNRSNGTWKLELWIPKNCVFEEFEDILERHAYVRGLVEAHTGSTAVKNSSHAYGDMQSSDPPVLRGKYVRGKVWGYRIVSQEETDIPIENDGNWEALCGQDDFTKMMRVVVWDSSKLAVICHETTLERPPPPSPPLPAEWKELTIEDFRRTWENLQKGYREGDVIHWGTDHWDLDGARLPDDF